MDGFVPDTVVIHDLAQVVRQCPSQFDTGWPSADNDVVQVRTAVVFDLLVQVLFEALDGIKRFDTVGELFHAGNAEVVGDHAKPEYQRVVAQDFAACQGQRLGLAVDGFGRALDDFDRRIAKNCFQRNTGPSHCATRCGAV